MILCVSLSGCGSSRANTKEYCPVCGESVEYEVDPEYALEWLLKIDYLADQGYFSKDDLQEIARDMYIDDPQCIAYDLLEEDSVLEYLKSVGWTIVPPGADYWEHVPANYHPVDESCVYWVKSGYAYHSTKDCVALKNSKDILHGSLKEAQKTGHDHPCSKCIEP